MKNVVRTAVVVTLLAPLAAPPLAAQAVSPNVERGFLPAKAYEASGTNGVTWTGLISLHELRR